jgi:hypothetical protein
MAQQSIDLKQIERKVWTSFFEDGIWDVYLGILLMAMAVGALLSDINAPEGALISSYAALLAVAVLFLFLGKRLITIPRIGRVNYGPEARARKVKTSIVLAFSVLVGLLAFVIVVLSAREALSRTLSMDVLLPAIWVSNMIVVFSLAAFFLRYKRLYLIGVMFAIAVPLDIVLRKLTHRDLSFVAFGLPALVILIMGSIVLVRFLRKYSKSPDGTYDARG